MYAFTFWKFMIAQVVLLHPRFLIRYSFIYVQLMDHCPFVSHFPGYLVPFIYIVFFPGMEDVQSI